MQLALIPELNLQDLKEDRKAILKLLEKDTILDKFYNFCILYDRIKEEYESKEMSNHIKNIT